MTYAPAADRGQRARLAKEARREEILAAARRVFAQRGFAGTTIADIAEEARVGLGTIYLYFESKDAVFGALNQLFGEIIAAAANAPTVGSLEKATRLRVHRIFEACGENRDLVQLAVLNMDPGNEIAKRLRTAEDTRNQPMVRYFGELMARGFMRAGDPVVVARLIQGLVSIAVYNAFVLSEGEQATQFEEACADMVVAYLTPPASAASSA